MLRLRPLRPGDEAEFRAGHELLARTDDFTFGLFLTDDLAWDDYVQLLADYRAGRHLPDHLVPSTFLVADVDGEIVGRTCDDDNVGCYKAIEACGGLLDPDEPYSTSSHLRRYWIA